MIKKISVGIVLTTLMLGVSVGYAVPALPENVSDFQPITEVSHKASTLNLVAATTPAPKVSAKNTMVDINKADVPMLMQLENVGEKRAKAIVDYRKEHGSFLHVEDLNKVKGISKALVKKNESRLTLG